MSPDFHWARSSPIDAMNHSFSSMVPIFLFLVVAGCGGANSKVGSQSVSTDDLFAEIHLTDTGGKVTAEVQLKRGGDTDSYIELEGGDQLIASTAGRPDQIDLSGDLFNNIDQLSAQQKRMKIGQDVVFDFLGGTFLGDGGIWYNATFEDTEPGLEVTVSLLRSSHEDAPGSTATMPDPFEMTEPAGGATPSRGTEEIPVRWSPSGKADAMTLSAVLTCENEQRKTWSEPLAGDTGSFTIPADTFNDLSGNCTVGLNLQRTRSGRLDAHYGRGGIITARQSRTVTFNTVE